MKHQKHYKRFLFLLAMLLTVTFAVAQTDERTKKQKDYLSFIQGQTISPFDYLSQKIKQYNVVSLGEDHIPSTPRRASIRAREPPTTK